VSEQPLWQPSQRQIEQAQISSFMRAAARRWGVALDDYAGLYRFSIEQKERFWTSIWEQCGVIGEQGERVLVDGDRMPGARWFPDAHLNFAQNLLRRDDDSEAMVLGGEDRLRRSLSWLELQRQVSRLAAALRAAGVCVGDRVAGYLPNLPETVIAMLATASIGATWCSTSPDFGVQGALDRLGQIAPRVLFAADGYQHKGRALDTLGKLSRIVEQLPSVERAVVVPHLQSRPDLSRIRGAALLADFIAPHPPGPIAFEQLPFDHPLYIMFSSGTTGAPKCIVHGAGGTLLQHLKEHRLHCDIRPGDRVFYYTTCGWMMWNWLASALASEAALLLYDGSPFHPHPGVLFDFAQAERMTLFGTSAKFIDAAAASGLTPRRSHDLAPLRLMTSTGSPLSVEGFDFVYRQVKPELQLASISGGTDIISCFVLGNPIGPVWRGEIQTRGLGMQVDVFDEQGRPLRGEAGELVCTAPFPSMPTGFWNDPGGERYRQAYFERFPGVWHHGDWAELTARDGVIIHGRSDATLNPGGVRIGTAEIYSQVEQLDEVVESVAVGHLSRGSERIVLFVVLRDDLTLDDVLVQKIRNALKENRSPFHVPARVIQVSDIPRTRNGKLSEVAVRDSIHGRPVKNRGALANPEALEEYGTLSDS